MRRPLSASALPEAMAMTVETTRSTGTSPEEIAEPRLMLHVTLLRTVHLHYGRTGFLSEMIYLRQSIAHEVEYLTAASIGTPSHQDAERDPLASQGRRHLAAVGASASGTRTNSSRTGRAASSVRTIQPSPRSWSTSSASISIHRSTPSCCRSTKRAKFGRSTAPSRGCR
jgi:hypothetical protein